MWLNLAIRALELKVQQAKRKKGHNVQEMSVIKWKTKLQVSGIIIIVDT
jgi:hypothetical protein